MSGAKRIWVVALAGLVGACTGPVGSRSSGGGGGAADATDSTTAGGDATAGTDGTDGDDAGQSGTCGGVPDGTACDDSNACTQDDQCSAGACLGTTSTVCEADSACAVASCDPEIGCVSEPAADGEPCSLGCFAEAACSAGECAPDPSTKVACPAPEGPCVDAVECDSATGECTIEILRPEGSDCDSDEDQCTIETCHAGGECSLLEVETCAEQQSGSPCWTWSCNKKAGCLQTAFVEGASCQDNNPCTINDTCSKGDFDQEVCLGTPVAIDDGDPCTDDACVDGTITHTPVPGCSEDPCPGGCDDGDPCTTDACVGGLCVFEPIADCGEDPCPAGSTCNDGDACTAGDTCQAGACIGGPVVDCDDQDTCTIDSCSPTQGCVHEVDPEAAGCAVICDPFAVQACYSGPDGTAGLGACKPGWQQCHQSGLEWSPCYDEVTPLAEDLCDNGQDDDCDGSESDEVCDSSGVGKWVDGEDGSDETGDGSFDNPWATIGKGVSSSSKLVIVKSDGDGTTYFEDVSLGGGNHGILLTGWGPTRPTLSGRVYVVHCYDCTVRDMILEYPADDGDPETNPPSGVIDTVHNYRGTWKNVRLTAPHGLPPNKNLARTHHGYDNLFIDVEVDDVVLNPDTVGTSYPLLNWNDHGSGSQFIRVSLGDVSSTGNTPDKLTVRFIAAWGYCDNWPHGVTAARSCKATDLDMSGWATTTRFEAFVFGCYLQSNAGAGVHVANNTVADITADELQFLSLNLAKPFDTWITSNIVAGIDAASSTGVTSNHPATVVWSDFHGLTTPTAGSATLGEGMLDTDPLFGADHHLAAGSPCIDAGDPALIDADTSPTDMGAWGGPYSLELGPD